MVTLASDVLANLCHEVMVRTAVRSGSSGLHAIDSLLDATNGRGAAGWKLNGLHASDELRDA